METKQWKDVLHIISGKNQKAVANPNGKYPIYGSGGIIGYADDYLCEAGTTIVGRKGTINKPIFVDEPFWNIDTAFGVVPGKKLNAKYLYYFCLYFNFMPLDKSTGRPSLAKSDLLKIKMPVPSLSKQEQIVKQIEESLSQLDSAVATLNKTKQQLEIYRQAVLKEAFLGKLSSHRPVSYSLPYFSSQESNSFPPIANEWKYIKLSCLGELARGKSKHRPRNDRKLFENGKYPFVQTGDVKKADKYITDYEKMYGDFGLQQSKLWKKGTLCITIAANIAETAFLGMDACFPDSVVGFLPSEYVLPEYIRYFIESQKVRLWAFAPATAQKNINLKTLENLVIPYCSIEEQAEIIKIVDEKMSVCDRINQVINQSLQQAEALRQSILKQAFSMQGKI